MKIVDSPDARNEVLARIKHKYSFDVAGHNTRTGIHISDLIYCITKRYWNDLLPDGLPSDEEVLYWAIGLGLEQVLLEDSNSTNRPQPVEYAGIWFSVDHQLLISQLLADLKTTRLYFNKEEEPTKGYPSGWIKQMAGYSYVYKQPKYIITIMQLITAKLFGKEIQWEDNELELFWNNYVIPRRDALIAARKAKLPPEPYAYNEPWECERCSKQILCAATKLDSNSYIAKRNDIVIDIPESMYKDLKEK